MSQKERQVEMECPRCEAEFLAEELARGQCPHCNNKYDWCWEEDATGGEIPIPIFESQPEIVKHQHLFRRDWV